MKILNILAAVALAMGAASMTQAQTVWHSPMENCGDEPYVCGRAWNKEIGKTFNRLPERFKDKVTPAVWSLSKLSAGLSLRFTTNSKNIDVKYILADKPGYLNMAWLNHSGVDLYATDVNGGTHWIGNHMTWKVKGDTAIINYKGISYPYNHRRGALFSLLLPPYNTVKSIEVGVDSGASFRFLHNTAEKPIVIYGTSIINGASPSRPGNMITNILQRELNYPIVNLGFSGSALMEPAIFDMLSEIDAKAYIIDPMPNSFQLNGDTIINRAVNGVRKLRAKSNAPILMVESCISMDTLFMPERHSQYVNGNKHFRDAYNKLKAEGVKNLYYMPATDIHFNEESMIEGSHPNDLGNREYADAYEKKIREMMPLDFNYGRFKPVTHRRNGRYEWSERHDSIIKLNRTTNPDVLMIGNSITHYWGGQPAAIGRGQKSWQKLFGKLKAVNMGFGSDRIENILYRLIHGELDDCAPKHVFLMAGVNNRSINTPEETAQGVAMLVDYIAKRQPQAKIHVMKMLPYDRVASWIAKTNDAIGKALQGKGVDVIDMTDAFTGKDGKENPELYIKDALHPNDKGYAVMAKILKKYLK